MFSVLVLFIVVVRNEVLSSSSSSPRVAVCISGNINLRNTTKLFF